jgi:hypothetical protein
MSYLSGALPGTMEEWELVAKGAISIQCYRGSPTVAG